jgi:hypothetical protein
LNYCAFHTVLPTLQEAIDTSPESPTAMIGNAQEIYGNLMEKHGLSKERQERLLKMVTDFSDY